LIQLPEACKKKFAMGYTREMFDMDNSIGGFLRDEIDRHGEALNLHMNKLVIDVAYGLYDTTTPGANMFPFIEGGIMWHTYQLVGAGGPWENDITGNPLDGTFVPFEAIEARLERLVDPYSGEAVVLPLDPKIVVTNAAARQAALDGLGVVQIGKDIPGSGNPRIAFERPAGRFGLGDGDIVSDRHAFLRLKKWFMTAAGGGLGSAAAEAAASSTWLYGNLSRAFAVGTQWDREKLVISGNQTWQYMMQEVVVAVKWMEKTTPAVLDPMLVIRNRA
jgi:hypothetical protein